MNLRKVFRRDILTVSRRKLRSIIYGEPEPLFRKCYSQCGEDMIVDFALGMLAHGKASYLDLGAYHPTRFSNTYQFYLKGCRGVCVEPNPALAALYKIWRPDDVVLQAGVGIEANDGVDFYVLTADALSTFSKEEAERICAYGNHKIKEVIRVPLLTVDAILSQHFTECPHFVNVDVESLDLAILKSFGFSRYRPMVFCVETITYAEDRTEEKIPEVSEFMKSVGYIPFGDTYINTIYVEAAAWRNR